ncbi:MAG: terminase family protein [Alphaproteobacteria bacterium]
MIASSPEKRREFLSTLNPIQAEHLLSSWYLEAHDSQLPPDPRERDWTTWVFMGGRGSGKTRAGAEWIRALVEEASEPLRIALVAESYAEARMTMVEGVSGLMNIGPAETRPKFLSSLRELRWANGSIAQIFSSEDPDGMRGPQYHAAWSDEAAKWRHGEDTWAMLQMGLRLGDRPRQVVTTTPKPVKHLRDILSDPGTALTHATSYDNRANLAPAFFAHIVKRYEGTALGRQELDGDLIEEIEGALFKRSLMEAARVRTSPELERIIVAVDPPVTAGDDADECGIIVAGAARGEAFVLADRSVQGLSPLAWASRVVETACEFEADRIVVEVNQGGDLVETLLREIDPALPVRKVRAMRGKAVRAEPIAALYERGLVHHVGGFAALEDQLANFTSGGAGRDDRLDALVWAISDLLLRRDAEPQVRKF